MSELPICGWCHQPYGTDVNAHRRNECPDMRDLSRIRPALLERVRAEARTAALAEREALDVERMREAARRAGLPHNVSVQDIESLVREYTALAETPEAISSALAAFYCERHQQWEPVGARYCQNPSVV